jgi:ankyrin repeat protein
MSSRKKHMSSNHVTEQSPVGSVYQRLMDLLTQNNGNFNKKNCFGETLLILAILEGSVSIVELLVNAGADIDLPDANGFTPLMYGILKNREDIVKYLVGLGAKAEVKNKYGKDSLDLKLDKLAMKSIIENIIKEQTK